MRHHRCSIQNRVCIWTVLGRRLQGQSNRLPTQSGCIPCRYCRCSIQNPSRLSHNISPNPESESESNIRQELSTSTCHRVLDNRPTSTILHPTPVIFSLSYPWFILPGKVLAWTLVSDQADNSTIPLHSTYLVTRRESCKTASPIDYTFTHRSYHQTRGRTIIFPSMSRLPSPVSSLSKSFRSFLWHRLSMILLLLFSSKPNVTPFNVSSGNLSAVHVPLELFFRLSYVTLRRSVKNSRRSRQPGASMKDYTQGIPPRIASPPRQDRLSYHHFSVPVALSPHPLS